MFTLSAKHHHHTISISIEDDDEPEPLEYFIVKLEFSGEHNHWVRLEPSNTTVFIYDNDDGKDILIVNQITEMLHKSCY